MFDIGFWNVSELSITFGDSSWIPYEDAKYKKITFGGCTLKTLEKSLLISSSSDVFPPLNPSVRCFKERGCKQIWKWIK